MMRFNEVFKFYSNIIDEMIESDDFFKLFFQRPTSYDDNMDGFCARNRAHYEVCFGASRGCIVSDCQDYVVKFDVEEYDYSRVEEDITEYAFNCGMDKYIAPCTYIGTYHKKIHFYDINDLDGFCCSEYFDSSELEDIYERSDCEYMDINIAIPLFAYPKAITHPHYASAPDRSCYDIASKHDSPLDNQSREIAARFIEEYGEDAYIEFSDFCLEHGINDIHTGNVGTIDGRFVIIDYAGFED